MRIRFLLYFSLATIHLSLGQVWEPVGGGVYGGDTLSSFSVNTLCVYNKKLYVGGAFVYAGKLIANHIACLNGTKWDTLSIGTNDRVESMCVYKNALCVGGTFNKAGRKKAEYTALWVDTLNTKPQWCNMGKESIERKEPKSKWGNQEEEDYGYDLVHGMVEYRGYLYIIGIFTSFPHVYAMHIAKWTGNKGWSQIGKPEPYNNNSLSSEDWTKQMNAWNAYPYAIAVYNNKVFVAQSVVEVENGKLLPPNRLLVWDDTNKSFIRGEFLKNCPSGLRCLLSTDSSLYLGGYYGYKSSRGANPLSGVSKYDGRNFTFLGNMNDSGVIFSMVFYNGKLYVGGTFDHICGKPANNIACWDGKSWEPVGVGFTSHSKWHITNVHALCVYKGELYAAGYFTSSGGKPVMNIAKLNLNGAVDKKKK